MALHAPLPDRFHGGIIGAFLYAVGGAMLTGYALPEPGIPLENPPGYRTVVWPLPGLDSARSRSRGGWGVEPMAASASPISLRLSPT